MSVGVTAPDYDLNEPLDPDVAGVFSSLNSHEKEWQMRARKFVQDEVLPVIAGHWDKAEYPLDLVKKMGTADLLRDGIEVPGFEPMSKLEAGLVTMELSRGDGSISTVTGVQGGLAMRSISMLGSDEQKEKFLAPLAKAEVFGAFALTEPTHGSDSVSLETSAVKTAGGYILNGEKKWIGNGSVGGVTVVWARGEDGQVHGFIVSQDSPGYNATTIEGKVSLRAIWQAHIKLEDVFVPEEMMLPLGLSFKDTSKVLQATRLGVAWGALGGALAAYETAVHYSKQRIQFGRLLAESQIVQERLARMLSGVTQLQTLVMALARKEEAGQMSGSDAAMGKYTSTRICRDVVANARDLLGGNGILLENRAARHFADTEALHTYEGTETVQALLIGREITGFSAFA